MSRSDRATPRSSPPPRAGRRADLLRDLAVLLGFVVACLAVGGLGALATSNSVATWYPTLRKPDWTPPAWVFGPVWTTLYAAMGTAAWVVWKRGGFAGQRVALSFFLAQLLFNALWSPLFFGMHHPGLAFADIALLWLALLGTVAAFWKARPLAGALLVPYLAWVTFASMLNFILWRLNR